MQHPDVFGAVYALSPGLFAPGGLAESQMFSDPTVVGDFLAGQEELAQMPANEAALELPRVMGRSADLRFSAAYGAAFAPDPRGPAPWIDTRSARQVVQRTPRCGRPGRLASAVSPRFGTTRIFGLPNSFRR